MNNTKKALLSDWLRIVIGLLIFGFGVHLTIRANIGLAPWDCLGMGISFHTPLNYGLSMTAISVSILVVDLLLGERIGFGTIIDAFCTGNFIELFNQTDPLPAPLNPFVGVLLMLVGLAIMALDQYLYMGAGQGLGPRDALFVAIGRRLQAIPIGAVQVGVFAVILLLGFLLGGPVGIGTIVSTFGAGAVMQAVFTALQFEPREVTQRDVLQVVSEWHA